MSDVRKAIMEAAAKIIGDKRAAAVAAAVLEALKGESDYLSESYMNSIANGEMSPCDGYCGEDS